MMMMMMMKPITFD